MGTSTSRPAVWQVSGGPSSRSYADVFLRHGVALIGPGDSGPWEPERSDEAFDGGFVRRFAAEITSGDVLLLRTGLCTVAAVGLVVGDYVYLHACDDVNGWDLQHARRVRWTRLPEPHVFASTPFGASPSRCSRVRSSEVVDFAERFLRSPPTHWQTARLPELPPEAPALGEPPAALRDVVARVADLVPLYQGGSAFGETPSEDELIAHFVVPLLLALGWPPERIAIKWRCIDVALFRRLPRTPENCAFVIEAKRLGAGVEGALDQAVGYAKALGQPCCDVVVTDGVRYRSYGRGPAFEATAYANLARLKQPAVDLFARLGRA